VGGPLGQGLERLIEGARQEVLLVAPYIKAGALSRLLDLCDPDVQVRVVTRWRIEEIAAGVSDLEVWPLLKARSAELWLHPDLHAKYYRSDHQRLIGSANLTAKALGWGPAPNLEILLPAAEDDKALEGFEGVLWEGASRVDDAVYDAYRKALALFPPPPAGGEVPVDLPETPFAEWRPQVRFLDDLHRYYLGDLDALTLAAREAASADLQTLDPPSGLAEAQLRAWIGLRLRLHPEMIAIHEMSAQSRRFGEMKDLLRARGSTDPGRDWQTWMRWISYLYPDEYAFREANYSEIFSRRAAF
jgi:hypothetical protein